MENKNIEIELIAQEILNLPAFKIYAIGNMEIDFKGIPYSYQDEIIEYLIKNELDILLDEINRVTSRMNVLFKKDSYSIYDIFNKEEYEFYEFIKNYNLDNRCINCEDFEIIDKKTASINCYYSNASLNFLLIEFKSLLNIIAFLPEGLAYYILNDIKGFLIYISNIVDKTYSLHSFISSPITNILRKYKNNHDGLIHSKLFKFLLEFLRIRESADFIYKLTFVFDNILNSKYRNFYYDEPKEKPDVYIKYDKFKIILFNEELENEFKYYISENYNIKIKNISNLSQKGLEYLYNLCSVFPHKNFLRDHYVTIQHFEYVFLYYTQNLSDEDIKILQDTDFFNNMWEIILNNNTYYTFLYYNKNDEKFKIHNKYIYDITFSSFINSLLNLSESEFYHILFKLIDDYDDAFTKGYCLFDYDDLGVFNYLADYAMKTQNKILKKRLLNYEFQVKSET